jgi:excisionase family DNA binding protein
MDTVPAMLLPEEVARLLRCSYRTIYKWIDEGKIPGGIKVCGIRRCERLAIEKLLGRKIVPGDLVAAGGKAGEGDDQ